MFVPNFKILGAVIHEKPLTQMPLCIILEREMEKGKKIKRKQNKFQHSSFPLHNIRQPSVGVYKI